MKLVLLSFATFIFLAGTSYLKGQTVSEMLLGGADKASATVITQVQDRSGLKAPATSQTVSDHSSETLIPEESAEEALRAELALAHANSRGIEPSLNTESSRVSSDRFAQMRAQIKAQKAKKSFSSKVSR